MAILRGSYVALTYKTVPCKSANVGDVLRLG